MSENDKRQDEHTEELPLNENVVWNHEDEVHMKVIEADDPVEEDQLDLLGQAEKKKDTVPSGNRRIILVALTVLIVIIVGALGFVMIRNYQQEQAKKQAAYDKIYDQLKVTFKEDEKDEDGNKIDLTIVEYGEKASDPEDLVDTHYGDLSYAPETIDTSKVGVVTVTYTVSMKDEYDELVTRDFTLDITVQDTQSPSITFKENKMTITEGESFDAKENIESVKDVIDGDIACVEKEPEKVNDSAPFYESGWYMITSEVDANTPGSYNVRIKACDVNGNSTDLAYSVTVKQKDPTSYMHIGSYTLTEKVITMAGATISDNTEESESTGSGPDDWANVEAYLGTTLYESDQYDSQESMMSNGKTYLSDHFDELVENKSGNSDTALGVTVTETSVSVYYMSALDEDGNAMYYFYAIV